MAFLGYQGTFADRTFYQPIRIALLLSNSESTRMLEQIISARRTRVLTRLIAFCFGLKKSQRMSMPLKVVVLYILVRNPVAVCFQQKHQDMVYRVVLLLLERKLERWMQCIEFLEEKVAIRLFYENSESFIHIS